MCGVMLGYQPHLPLPMSTCCSTYIAVQAFNSRKQNGCCRLHCCVLRAISFVLTQNRCFTTGVTSMEAQPQCSEQANRYAEVVRGVNKALVSGSQDQFDAVNAFLAASPEEDNGQHHHSLLLAHHAAVPARYPHPNGCLCLQHHIVAAFRAICTVSAQSLLGKASQCGKTACHYVQQVLCT